MKRNKLTPWCITAMVIIFQVSGLTITQTIVHDPPRLHGRTIRQAVEDEHEFVGGGGYFTAGGKAQFEGNVQVGGDDDVKTAFIVEERPIRPPIVLPKPQTPYLTNDIHSGQPKGSIFNRVNGVRALSGKGAEGMAALLALVQSPAAISGGFDSITDALTSTVRKLPLNSEIALPGSLTGEFINFLTSPVAILKDFSGAIGVALSGTIGLITSPMAICGQIFRGGIDVNTISPEDLPVNSIIRFSQSLTTGSLPSIAFPAFLVISFLGSFAILFAVIVQVVVTITTVMAALFKTIVGGFSTIIIRSLVGASAVPLTLSGEATTVLHSIALFPGSNIITTALIKIIVQSTDGIRSISGGIGNTLTEIIDRIGSFAVVSRNVILGGLREASYQLFQEQSLLGNDASMRQSTSASANMPKAVSAGLSESISTFISGISALTKVPAAVSGQSVAQSFFNFGSSDDIIGIPSNGNTESFITGIATIVQSPVFSLQKLSGYIDDPLAYMIGKALSPIVASGGTSRAGAEMLSPQVVPDDSVLGKSESIGLAIAAVLQSPVLAIKGVSAGLANIAVGILGVLTSPLGISGRIIGGHLGGFGSSEIPQASHLPNSGTVIHTFVQSPAVLIQTMSAGVVQGFFGIIATLSSPVTVSGQMVFNSLQVITSSLLPPVSNIRGLSHSLFMSTINAVQSPGLTLQIISGSIMNAYNGLLTIVASPVSFSGRVLDGMFTAISPEIQSTTGSFLTGGVIDGYVDSAAFVASIPGRLVKGLSGGALASIASVITTVTSPLAISGNLILYTTQTLDRLININSNDRTSTGMIIQTISTIFNQPLLIPKFSSGSGRVFIGEILSRIISPLAFSGQIVEAILKGLSPNIYFLPQSGLGTVHSIVTSIVTAVGSPGIVVRGLSAGLSAVINDFLGTVTSPVTISGQTIGGISTILSSLTAGSPITAVNSVNLFDGGLFEISLLPIKALSGFLTSLVSSPLAVVTSPLTLSGRKVSSILEEVTSGLIELPWSFRDATSAIEQIGLMINSPIKILQDFSVAFREIISSIVNLALSPIRFLSGSRCFCL